MPHNKVTTLENQNSVGLYYASRGWIYPICYLEDKKYFEDLKFYGLLDEELLLSNNSSVENILRSNQWQSFINHMLNNPEEKNRLDYQMYVSKNYIEDMKNICPNFDINNTCPLRCPQCSREYIHNPTTEYDRYWFNKNNFSAISIINLQKLIDFFSDSTLLTFCGCLSDPVFHPQILDIFKLCSTKYSHKKFQINTAAPRKDLAWYEKAFSLTPNFTWVFGLDGLPDLSPIYRIHQNSQLIYEAIKLGAKLNNKIVWQMLVFDFNKHQIKDVSKICKHLGIDLYLIFTNRNSGDPEFFTPMTDTYYKRTYKIKNNKISYTDYKNHTTTIYDLNKER